MKKYILLIFSLFFAYTSFAQYDNDAKIILNKVSKKTKSHSSIKVDFVVKYSDLKDNSSNTSKGNIILKGDKYILDFMNSTTYFNGETLWSYLKDVNEVNISEPDKEDNDIFSHPNKIFTIYEEGYKYKYLGELVKNNTSFYSIDLYPEDLNNEYSRIRLEINKSKLQISSARIFYKNGTRYLFSISNYVFNQQIPDSKFLFNTEKYPDIEVIDLRW